jgi:hypothetical protein
MSTSPFLVVTKKTTNSKRRSLWQNANGKCHWCRCDTRLVDDNSWDRATVDHVIPRYRGGSNDRSNLVNACNRCNNRRNYEDMTGVPEGSMLGKYKQSQTNAERKEMRRVSSHGRVALTGDEKKAIMAGNVAPPPTPAQKQSVVKHQAEDVLREQRDQALRELKHLNNELKLYKKIVEDQEKELKAMTVWKLIRKRIAEWIRP